MNQHTDVVPRLPMGLKHAEVMEGGPPPEIIPFSQSERDVIEEEWANFQRTVLVIARIHKVSIPALNSGLARLTEDRSGIQITPPKES